MLNESVQDFSDTEDPSLPFSALTGTDGPEACSYHEADDTMAWFLSSELDKVVFEGNANLSIKGGVVGIT